MSNPFQGWTLAQVNEHNRRVAGKASHAFSETTDSEKPVRLRKQDLQPMLATKSAEIIRHESTDIQKLNKTERAFYNQLMAEHHQQVWVQAVTLKLADDCRLTVDFVHLTYDGKLVFTDVKGFQREDALIKMKVAARSFPIFIFQIVKRIQGKWEIKVVKP